MIQPNQLHRLNIKSSLEQSSSERKLGIYSI